MGVSQAVCCLNDHRSPLRLVEQTSGTESSEGFVRLEMWKSRDWDLNEEPKAEIQVFPEERTLLL